MQKDAILLLPDAGPLIKLAYANALDLLFKPGWLVQIVDMVLVELTRNETPTSKAIATWIKKNKLQLISTKTHQHYQRLKASNTMALKKANLGETAIQEAMNDLALLDPSPTGIFLFEDHKIARTSFLLPASCRKISTRAFLIFLEQKGWLESAVEVEREAIQNGRHFSQLRFPSS
jgi:hypothetical protein